MSTIGGAVDAPFSTRTMESITARVSEWPGVSVEPHRYGGEEYTLNGREVGHVHGTRQADVPFAKRLRDVLVAEGKTEQHHLYPESGWVTHYLDTEADVEEVIELLRISYLYHVRALRRRDGVDPAIASIDVERELGELNPSAALRAAFDGRTTA